VFEITSQQIEKLDDGQLRELVFKLCEAELKRHGLPLVGLTAGGNQTAADGGIDVRVELASSGNPQLDFIQRRVTGFQVKCQDLTRSKIRAEMRPKDVLRSSIKTLIAQGGAYILVRSKGSLSDTVLNSRLQAMQEAVATEADAANLKLDFYDSKRLATWINSYPGVEMWMRNCINERLQGWQPYACWTNDQTKSLYLHDDMGRLLARTSGSSDSMTAVAGIDALRKRLRFPGSAIRLVGLSGTGKTRLVQALFEADIGSSDPLDIALAVYTDLGQEPEPSAREMILQLGASKRRAVVIVDNCNPETHRTLIEAVARDAKQISLVTVEYDVSDDEPEGTDVFELKPSSVGVLDQILARLNPDITLTDRQRIAEFSGGNARIALALARTVRPGQSLGALNDTSLFRRLFVQGQTEDEALLRAAEVCSLLYSFDSQDITPDSSELGLIARLAGSSIQEVYRHVAELQRRDLIQARSRWRAVLPPALANRLAKSALENLPRADILAAFEPHARLLKSFSRRLGSLHDSDEACAIAVQWMSDEAWLASPVNFNQLGISLFCNVAPLVPDKTLEVLERAVSGEHGAEFSSTQGTDSHPWLSLARKLSYESDQFEQAARIVLAFAAAETADKTDAKNAWQELFYCALSGTLAPPKQRASLLRSLVSDSSPQRRKLAFVGVEAMLKIDHFTSAHDFSFGARPRGFGWELDSDGKFRDWFDVVFSLMREVAELGSENRDAVRNMFAGEMRQLWLHVDLQQKVVDFAFELSDSDGWPSGWIAVRNLRRLDSPSMASDSLVKLNELESRLSPKSLRQEVLAYVSGYRYDGFDVDGGEDADDAAETANPVSAYDRINQKVIALGEAACGQDELLTELVPVLLSSTRGRLRAFGVGLGRASRSPKEQWQRLSEAYQRISPEERNEELLTGYLEGVRETNIAIATQLLNELIADEVMGPLFPWLQGWSNDDEAADRLLLAIETGLAPARAFRVHTARRDSPGLSVEKYVQVIRRVASMPDGLAVAIESLSMEYYLCRGGKAPLDERLRQLGHELFDLFAFGSTDHNLPYKLKELANVCLVGEAGLPAAKAFALKFAVALADHNSGARACADLACALFKHQPQISLDAFLLVPPGRSRSPLESLFERARGKALQCAGNEAILSWGILDPDVRLPLIAAEIDVLGETADRMPMWSDLASRLLELASNKTPILEAFNRHFQSGQWSGSLEQALTPYLNFANQLKNDPSPEVATWAARHVHGMEESIAQDRLREAISEERFE
jgi:hypothetical protein